MTARTFEARGCTRGACRHAHRTVTAAQECADREARACKTGKSTWSFSDRSVEVRTSGDGPQYLTDNEKRELAAHTEATS